MILQPVAYDIPNLLHGDDAVAVCQLDGAKLKNMILTVRDRGWGLAVVKAASGEHFLLISASQVHQDNLIGDVRSWTQQYGYQFFLKLSSDQWPTHRPNVFVLPDGRMIEIRNFFTKAGNYTHWCVSQRTVVPAGYVRL